MCDLRPVAGNDPADACTQRCDLLRERRPTAVAAVGAAGTGVDTAMDADVGVTIGAVARGDDRRHNELEDLLRVAVRGWRGTLVDE